MSKTHSVIKYIDVFSGCGGFSLGMRNAGFNGIFAIERDDMAFETFHHNLIDCPSSHFHWPEWLPAKAHTIEGILRKYKSRLSSLRGSVDLLVGGPPCQGFSLVGQRNHSDPRNKLVNQYVKMVRTLEPKFLIMENVRGFNVAFRSSKSKIPAGEKVMKLLDSMNYNVFWKCVNAADFGVPQCRVRFIMIGVHKDWPIKVDPFAVLEEIRPSFLRSKGLPLSPISAKEAIGDLETQTEYSNLIAHRDKGFLHLDYAPPKQMGPYLKLMRHNKRLRPNSLRLARHRPATIRKFKAVQRIGRPGAVLNHKEKNIIGVKKQVIGVLSYASPSRTLTTVPDDIIHYSEPRILTVRECARLQSFPDNFEFRGQYTTGGKNRKKECPRYTQVGNAVPPLLGEALALSLREAIS